MYVWRTNQRDSLTDAFVFGTGLLSLFFILLMLVLISNSQISLPGTTVRLPSLEHVRVTTVDKLVITVTRDSELFFNGALLSWDDLAVRLSERVEESRLEDVDVKPMIVVCADREVNLQTWFRLADMARNLGLDIYLASEQPDAVLPEKKNGNAHLDEQL